MQNTFSDKEMTRANWQTLETPRQHVWCTFETCHTFQQSLLINITTTSYDTHWCYWKTPHTEASEQTDPEDGPIRLAGLSPGNIVFIEIQGYEGFYLFIFSVDKSKPRDSV